MANSCIKVDFFRRKSDTKFLCLKTVSGKVLRHLLAYLTVHKWFMRDVPLNVNFVHKVTTRCHGNDGQHIFMLCAGMQCVVTSYSSVYVFYCNVFIYIR